MSDLIVHIFGNLIIYLLVFIGIFILIALSKSSEWTIIRTYNIDLESSRKIQRLFDEIGVALRGPQFWASNLRIDRKPGSISVTSVKIGRVVAKLIGRKSLWRGEHIMLGVSANPDNIKDQNWGSYDFPEKYRIGVAGKDQPFFLRELPQDQTAIDETIEIVGMISKKLNIP